MQFILRGKEVDCDEKENFHRSCDSYDAGIYNGQNKVDARVKQKLKQTNQSSSTGLPTYVSVVEFSEPSVTFVKKK